ncbi:flagellar protein FliT [Sulfurirhabdus autotrophica]|uniref:Flagellar protein FliT n=1 Tax=Sulfurirhabdus autotrophica TaxID=1706046 RepID=A0A4R3YGT6_9PROT|nr:flagellar protein FliT [Sulfurirhabdus autotrophica]TCV90164.1 flagellar protein FliT [Sulfurirhabdus autotrophica]
MSTSKPIQNYELLSTLMEQMREAAINGKWEQLITLEQKCSDLVVKMKQTDIEEVLDNDARQHKTKLISKILSDDSDIRNHTQTWMIELQTITQSINQSIRQGQKLQDKYGV